MDQGSQKSNVRSWFLAASNSRNLRIHRGNRRILDIERFCFVGFLSLQKLESILNEEYTPSGDFLSFFKPFETRESIGTIPEKGCSIAKREKRHHQHPPATKTSLPGTVHKHGDTLAGKSADSGKPRQKVAWRPSTKGFSADKPLEGFHISKTFWILGKSTSDDFV